MNGATRSHARACSGKNRDGSPCKSAIVAANGWCLQHDPARADERQAAYRAGGRARSTVRRAAKTLPYGLAGVLDRLTRALEETHRGEITPAQASGMAALARAIVAVTTAGEFEDRLRALEATIGSTR